MPISQLGGIVPPIVTPLKADGSVDLAGLEKHTEHLVTAGVDGIFALGSSAEVAYLTDMEREQVLRTIVATVADRVPVVAGAIELTAARCIEAGQRAVAAGASAVVVTPPVYAINDSGEIADHFRMIARALSVPLFAYDVPVRVHSKLSAELLVSLGVEGVLAGVKDSSGDDVFFRRLVALNNAAGHPLQLFTGHEVVVDAMAFIGADGAVPGLANVEVGGYVRLWQAAQRGDWDEARREQGVLNQLFEIVFCSPGYSGDAAGVGAFKVAMAHRGLIDNPKMRPPIRPLAADRMAAIERVCDSL